MEILKFRKGDIIFEEGDLEDWMYEIRKGMVGIYAGYGTPEEKELMKITTPYSRDKIYGLTREHAERAIEILMREAPYCDRNNRD